MTTPTSLIALLVLIALLGNSGGVAGVETHSAIAYARCEVVCYKNDKNDCVRTCLEKNWQKPGQCPLQPSIFAAACLQACQYDNQCYGMEKCCKHRCGATCQQGENLQQTPGLPEVPTDVKVSEGKKKRTITIKWQHMEKNTSPILYVLEECHQTGANYVENKMSEWSTCATTFKTTQILRNYAKPGRWYQFRVAAINENGTRGFSEGSNIYTPTFSPRPPEAPQNVSVEMFNAKNGKVDVEIRWKAPHSDLPIQKYKIFCSRRLHGAKPLDSVRVDQQVVSKENTKSVMRNLQVNATYFVQVQAIVQFDRKRLKGEMASLPFNTTHTNNPEEPQTTINTLLDSLKVGKVFLSRGELKARINWKNGRKVPRYGVTWWTGPCKNSNKITKTAVIIKGSHFDLYDLNYECRVRVSVKEVGDDYQFGSNEQSVTFKTPTCQELQAKLKKPTQKC